MYKKQKMISKINKILYQFVNLVLISFFLMSTVYADDNRNENLQPFDEEYANDIAQSVYDYVSDSLELESDEKAEIEVSKISNRLKHPICEGEFQYSVATKTLRKNNSIKVVCDSQTTPYFLYVNVRITVMKPYVTVINAVNKNSVLDVNNLTIEYMDKVLDKGTTFKDVNILANVKTKRDIKPGSPIHKNQICVICKGDEITIELASNGLVLKTKGEAQQDGSYNDTIRVKNVKSGKFVRGRIINNETVLISK